MPNRVLRDWTTSQVIDQLSSDAEVFFTRLIMKADDYGSYYANPKLIKAALFPLRNISENKITDLVNECVNAGLLANYAVNSKEFIRILEFGQRLRNMRNAFPHPEKPLAAIRRESPPETKRNETNQETDAGREIVYGSVGKFRISIKPKYLFDKIKIIYDLKEFFKSTEQLDQLEMSGNTSFHEFIKNNPGAVYDDDMHVYRAFMKFCATQINTSKPNHISPV